MPAVNWLAVVAAALSMFVIGGLWYSVLFEKVWMAANGFAADDMKRGSVPVIFGVAFVLSFVIAANLAFFISGVDLTSAIAYSVAAGLGFAALSLSQVAMFERRPLSYHLVNGGYLTVAFAVMGLILGLWK